MSPGQRFGPLRGRVWPVLLVFLFSALLRFAALPPFSLAELALVAWVPVLFVLSAPGRIPGLYPIAWLGSAVFWFISLFWLRHVTLPGLIGLAGALAFFDLAWIGYVRGTRSRWAAGGWGGLGGALGLAAAWVVLEWLRTWILWGFPWNPYALAFWNRPAMLQVAALTGMYGVSFALILLNVGIVQWLRGRLALRRGTKGIRLGFWTPVPGAVVAGVLLLVLPGIPFLHSRFGPPENPLRTVRVGVVQPYTLAKWDEASVQANLGRLWRLTRKAGEGGADLVVWPEAATPMPVLGNRVLRDAIEDLAAEIGRPILMGNLAYREDPEGYWNGVFLVDPAEGLAEAYYAKRELVPFGEYIPFRRFLPGVEAFVPLGADTIPGEEPVTFAVEVGGGPVAIGGLVCYEDVFPGLARSSAPSADLLFVATNNAWYGEEWGAQHHAYHAVLRAVETRRPIVRCGNAGWSGWIDEWGVVRHTSRDASGSIYFAGVDLFPVEVPSARPETLFVRWGDWFVVLAAVLAAGPLVRWGGASPPDP